MKTNAAGNLRRAALCLILAGLVFAVLAAPALADTASEIAQTWVRKGDDLAAQERYAEAIDAYNEALGIDPYQSIAWNKLGLADMKAGRNEDAVQAFQKALDIDPYYSAAWNNKGDALHARGDYQAAIDAYDRALAINANDLYALLQKGVNLQEKGNPDEAMKVYEEVVRLADREVRKHPNDARYDAGLWTNKGDALAHLGRPVEALEAYQSALQINPKYERAIRGSEMVNDTMLRVRGTAEEYPVPTTVTPGESGKVPVPLFPLDGPLAAAITAVFTCWLAARRRAGR